MEVSLYKFICDYVINLCHVFNKLISDMFTVNTVTHKNSEEMTLIRKADIENHNRDGGLWVPFNNKVYDILDLRLVTIYKNNIRHQKTLIINLYDQNKLRVWCYVIH